MEVAQAPLAVRDSGAKMDFVLRVVAATIGKLIGGMVVPDVARFCPGGRRRAGLQDGCLGPC